MTPPDFHSFDDCRQPLLPLRRAAAIALRLFSPIFTDTTPRHYADSHFITIAPFAAADITVFDYTIRQFRRRFSMFFAVRR